MDTKPNASDAQPQRAAMPLDRAGLQKLIDPLNRYDLTSDGADERGDLSVQLCLQRQLRLRSFP